MAVEIRRVQADFADWDGLLKLLHAAFAFQQDRIDPPSSLYRLNAATIAEKAEEERLFIAVDDGRLVGCMFAKAQGGAMYVGKMAVWPEQQGRGIGRRLMRAAEDYARRSGLPALELETRIELTENHRTFAAMGFVKVAEKAHEGYDRATSITMRKTL